MKYEIFEHTSDIGLQIYGSSFKELLENAGFALFEQITDLSRVETLISIEVSAEGKSDEELLMAWLRELLYLFHVEQYLLSKFDIYVLETGLLKASVKGEKMDISKHVMEGEVKGITYHNLELTEINGKWQARIVLDV